MTRKLNSTVSGLRHNLGRSRVYVANRLTGEWTEQKYLFCDSIDMRAGPGIDQASFRYDYGDFRRRWEEGPGILEPLDLNRKYVRVDILNREGEVRDQWWGTFEVDRQKIDGTARDIKTGTQSLTAYGLARELELQKIDRSIVLDPQGNPLDIPRGITFNFYEGGKFADRGNRSESRNGQTYVFSNDPKGGQTWSGSNAIEYLLHYYAPKRRFTGDTAPWKLTGATDALDWYDFTTATDRRSFKEVLDDIVDRKRMVNYHVRGRMVEEQFQAEIFIFTSLRTPIPIVGLSRGPTQIPSNTNTLELDLEDYVDVEPVIVNSSSTIKDEIMVEGEYITSTFNAFHKLRYDTVNDGCLENGWTEEDETAFKAGASSETGYGDLSDTEKQDRNQQARSKDKYRDVFSRFTVRADWTLKQNHYYDTGTYYVISKNIMGDNGDNLLPISASSDEVKAFFQSSEGFKVNNWLSGRRFLRSLPKADDYSEYTDPVLVFFVKEEESSAGIFCHGEDLNTLDGYSFSFSLSMLDDALGIRLRCGLSGGQSLLGRGLWSGAAATPSSRDPLVSGNNARSITDFIATVAIEWDQRCFWYESTGQNAGDPMNHRHYVYIPDARLDIIIPTTITGIDNSGKLVYSEGEVIRDDRPRLRAICQALKQWYAVPRQGLQLAWSQVDPFTIDKTITETEDDEPGQPKTPAEKKIEIGCLVTSIGESYSETDVNSPVTGLAYDFLKGMTRIETSYADAEFT